jgi:hypothetical protein
MAKAFAPSWHIPQAEISWSGAALASATFIANGLGWQPAHASFFSTCAACRNVTGPGEAVLRE